MVQLASDNESIVQTPTTTTPSTVWLVIRWICVLPGALIGGFLAGVLANILNKLSLAWVGFNPEWFVSRLYTDAIANVLLGVAGIYVGAKIAPAYKSRVALALSALMLIAAGFFLFPTVQARDWWGVYATAMLIVGAGGTAWSIYSGETKDSDFMRPFL